EAAQAEHEPFFAAPTRPLTGPLTGPLSRPLTRPLTAPLTGPLTGPVRERGVHGSAVATRPLTDRQREVLSLIREGKTDRQIADTLGVSEHTVSAHVQGLHNRLGAPSRGEALALFGAVVE